MDGHPLSLSLSLLSEELEGGDPLSVSSPLFSPLLSSKEARGGHPSLRERQMVVIICLIRAFSSLFSF